MTLYKPGFLKSLVIVSVVAVFAIPLYILVFLTPAINQFLVENAERDAESVANHLATMFIPHEKVVSKETIFPHLSVEIQKVLNDFNLTKVKIYSPRGEVVYSTDPVDIGKISQGGYFQRIVAKGVPYSAVVKKDSLSLEGQIMPLDVVEAYVPIMEKGVFIGAFEIYYDITKPKEKFNSFIHHFYVTLFIITIFLFVAVIVSSINAHGYMAARARAEKKIIKQSIDLKKMNSELSVLYEISQKRQEETLAAQQEKLEALERVQEEKDRSREMRLELLRHTVKAQEDERTRISRELHDETAQVLTAASLNMEALKKYVVDHPEAEELIGRSKNLCRQMSQGLYRLVHDLRPAQLDDLGLVPALEHLIEDGSSAEILKTTLQISGQPQRLDPFVETVLFRAAQEALTNASKYAGTDKASIQLHFDADKVVLRVRDKGSGFDPENRKPDSKSGWGLAGIRERVESVNGDFLVQSSPGMGTLIEVVVPLADEKGKNQGDFSEVISG
jgi:signal transduction histidine kinase